MDTGFPSKPATVTALGLGAGWALWMFALLLGVGFWLSCGFQWVVWFAGVGGFGIGPGLGLGWPGSAKGQTVPDQ